MAFFSAISEIPAKVVFAGILCCVSLSCILIRLGRRPLRTMKGPKGYPLIGIGLGLPSNGPEIMRQWALEYGEIFKVRVGWYDWVVVNSPEAMKEIFDKQSALTSSKMPLPIGDDVLTGGMRMFTMPYGSKWRAFRTIVHQVVSPQSTQTFIPTQEFEIKQLLAELGENNNDDERFYSDVRRMSFSIIMTSTYGRRVSSWYQEDVKASAQSSKLLATLTASFIEDAFPPLAKLPHWMQPSRKKAEAFSVPVLEAKMHLWNRMKDALSKGKAPSCFGKELMQSDYEAKGLTEKDAAWIAGGLVEAGSETTSVTLNNLILHLAAYPAVQAQVGDELSRVVGEARQPCFEDLASLPLVKACVKEMMRLRPLPTWGIKHFTDGDITYKHHIIPKGTILLGNTAALHFDPSRYEDPFSFDPSRYLEHSRYSADYAAMGDPHKRDHYTFGAGRRICPGSRLAENTLELALANILWAYEIRPPFENIDEKEREVKMDISEDAFEDTAFRAPKPFRVRFVPRGEKRATVVRRAWETAQSEGYVLRGQKVNVDGVA